jgi:hypothetical protein
MSPASLLGADERSVPLPLLPQRDTLRRACPAAFFFLKGSESGEFPADLMAAAAERRVRAEFQVDGIEGWQAVVYWLISECE